LGAKYKVGKRVFNIGSCAHSDFCVFSLHPVKTITSGEGGLVTTNNQSFAEKIKLLRSHGIIKSSHWKYDIKFPALNYRLSDINCALALSQLKRIKKFISTRKEIFNLYKNSFLHQTDLLSLPNYEDVNRSSFHLFLVKINFSKLTKNKDFFIKEMLKKKIMLQFHYIPIFLFKNIYKSKFQAKDFLGSLSYQKTHVSLPIYVGLEKKYIISIVKKINQFIKKYKK
jgi:dTDP-4-amino-4,6-dideoxygalactose transaminase